ncbi:MAG: hypothetical protein JOZ98_04690 [Solirubrobacterales bacterium]|nr:hypothetical protein [Solirubrobacterales bacterium]MBV9800616.1 hypothetical protein [Solirubrobacterales bacterium]
MSQRYRLVVRGELGARYASAFEGMTICAHDGITEITGAVIDAAHLHSLLERIASLGLVLNSLAAVAPGPPKPPASPPGRDPASRERTRATDIRRRSG